MIFTDITEGNLEVKYTFDFVGVVVLGEYVFKCYPKYISSTLEPVQQLKQVLKVIQKYNDKEQAVYLCNGEGDSSLFNRLSLSLYLLEDYFQHGIYRNQHEIIEKNGEGEILWDQTISQEFALVQDNIPYYLELQTGNIVDNETDYFKRLHECVLSQCSSDLKKSGILELFDIRDVGLTGSKIEDFGGIDYILYRLQKEIQIQFITKKQNILKAIYTYIANENANREETQFSFYGTGNFNLVWEKVCAENFDSVLDMKLEKLPLGVCSEYMDQRNKTLRNMIEKPIWHKNNPPISDDNTETLRPDLICIYPVEEENEYCFGIFDAKYYCIDFKQSKSGHKVTGQPGVGDVSKQYLYQLAYDDFIIKQGYKYVQNMFLCPQEKGRSNYGYVEMKFLSTIGGKALENIAIVKLCAEEMYDLYLSNIQIKNMSKYIPNVIRKKVYEKNFTSRIAAYLQKITDIDLLAVEKTGAVLEQNKPIYPQRIKREPGVKLIYDMICLTAKDFLFGFNPYEKKYAEMVAEDKGDIYEICEQIAEAAIGIEKYIKRLTEGQLRDESIIRTILKQCFRENSEIAEMACDHSLDKLTIKVMKLIEEVYL
ncbi:MAG: LlaJI family restriction endonuclease [Lachnospiraceae bacterium]|nr:LlaJI family restriction endonuclease [Lachnospiraceae bacterium]